MLCLFLDEQSKYESLKTSSEIIYVDDFSSLVNFIDQHYDVIVFASGDFVSILSSLKGLVKEGTKVFKPQAEIVPLELDFKTFSDPESFLAELSSTRILSMEGLDFDEKLNSEGTRNSQLDTAINQVIPDAEKIGAMQGEDTGGLDIKMPEVDDSLSLSDATSIDEIEDVTVGDITLDDFNVDDISLAADDEIVENNQAIDDDSIDLGDVSDDLDLAADRDNEEVSEQIDDSIDLGDSVGDLDLAGTDDDVSELNADTRDVDDSLDLDHSETNLKANSDNKDGFDEDTGKTLVGDISELGGDAPDGLNMSADDSSSEIGDLGDDDLGDDLDSDLG